MKPGSAFLLATLVVTTPTLAAAPPAMDLKDPGIAAWAGQRDCTDAQKRVAALLRKIQQAELTVIGDTGKPVPLAELVAKGLVDARAVSADANYELSLETRGFDFLVSAKDSRKPVRPDVPAGSDVWMMHSTWSVPQVSSDACSRPLPRVDDRKLGAGLEVLQSCRKMVATLTSDIPCAKMAAELGPTGDAGTDFVQKAFTQLKQLPAPEAEVIRGLCRKTLGELDEKLVIVPGPRGKSIRTARNDCTDEQGGELAYRVQEFGSDLHGEQAAMARAHVLHAVEGQCTFGDAAGCKKQCEGGHGGSCVSFAMMHEGGFGVPKDLVRASDLYRSQCTSQTRRGCDRGIEVSRLLCSSTPANLRGCANLGAMYATAMGSRRAAAERPAALEALNKACSGKHPGACHTLGLFLIDDRAVDGRDEARAAKLFEQDCTGGIAEACLELARSLRTGKGAAKDEKKSLELFQKACAGGATTACAEGGSALLSTDAPRAAAMLQKACDADEQGACYSLKGHLGRECRGGKQDACKAEKALDEKQAARGKKR